MSGREGTGWARFAAGALGILVSAAALHAVGCDGGATESSESGCSSDDDCKSSRICESGECVEPESGSGPGASSGSGGSTGSGGLGGPGPAPRCKAYPGGNRAIAALNEALGAAEVQHAVTFFDEGAIETVGATSCAQITSAVDPMTLGTNWMTCFEAYDCGGCEVWEGYYAGDGAEFPEGWYLISRDQPPSCARYAGFYQIVEPAFASGGGSVIDGQPTDGPGDGSACDACLAECPDAASCCTGVGCACQSACGPTECVAGTTLCVGPDGSALCMSNCPY